MKQIEVARSLLGVPWRHQGRDPAIGIDCIGLLLLAFDAADDTVYGRNPTNGLLAARCEHHLGPPVADGPLVGDVLLLGFGVAGEERHIGLIANDEVYGGLSIIHTDSVVGKVVEHPFDEKWQRRVRKVYRHREVADE